MDSKKDIRKYVLRQRECMNDKDRDEKSHKIFEKVVNHPFFLNAGTIYCYVDYMHEVETHSIIRHAWKLGKKVAVPKIVDNEMLFYYIRSFDDLSEGFRGILEPDNCELAREESPLVLMPGVAYDKFLNRIGYGRGFYDKFLMHYPKCHTIALGFELQIVSSIQQDTLDIRPEILITEDSIYGKPTSK